MDGLAKLDPDLHNRICLAGWSGYGFGQSYGQFVTTDERRIDGMAVAASWAAANLQLIVEAFASSNVR